VTIFPVHDASPNETDFLHIHVHIEVVLVFEIVVFFTGTDYGVRVVGVSNDLSTVFLGDRATRQ
jgi:hypothetical protein